MSTLPSKARLSAHSLHALGVFCGLAAATWLAAAEAPTKLVTAGFSPFLISLGMVAGVFVARWTCPWPSKEAATSWRTCARSRTSSSGRWSRECCGR